MSHAEWLACENPARLLAELKESASARKVRLFICACGRRVRHLLPDERSRAAIEVAERLADGEAVEKELAKIRAQLSDTYVKVDRRVTLADTAYGDNPTAATASAYAAADAMQSALNAASKAIKFDLPSLERVPGVGLRSSPGLSAACAVAADVEAAVYRTGADSAVANVAKKEAMKTEEAFHAALVRDMFGNAVGKRRKFKLEWRTNRTLAIAGEMYESHEFAAMPKLADALQKAGCRDKQILAHCRGAGPHARGCWVIDLVLDKE